MVKYWERLKPLMDERGISKQALADTIGVSFQAIAKVEAGGFFGSVNNIKAAQFFNVSPEWLATGKNPSDLPSQAHQVFPQNRVPVLSWSDAKNYHDAIDSLIPANGEQILITCPKNTYTYALRVKDDMNSPKFPIDSWLVVEPEETPVDQKWCIVDEGGEEATCKQLVIDGATRYLRSDNARFPIKEMTKNARFCGTVKQLIVAI